MATVQSMTGYGRAQGKTVQGEVTIEIKSVNHRSFDLFFRGSREFSAHEAAIRSLVNGALGRGRVEVILDLTHRAAEAVDLHIDLDLAQKYHSLARQLGKKLKINADVPLEFLLRVPNIVYEETPPVDEESCQQQLLQITTRALRQVTAMRKQEGRSLAKDIRSRLALLEKSVRRVAALRGAMIESFRANLEKRIQDMVSGVPLDPGRLEQEVAYLVERSDIQEEVTRLESHLAQFRKTLGSEESIGRQLDFLCQEMIRESNTIGSKANNLDITRQVLGMKGEIEKIREQAQNLR